MMAGPKTLQGRRERGGVWKPTKKMQAGCPPRGRHAVARETLVSNCGGPSRFLSPKGTSHQSSRIPLFLCKFREKHSKDAASSKTSSRSRRKKKEQSSHDDLHPIDRWIAEQDHE